MLIPVDFKVTWMLGLTFHRIGPVDLTEQTVAHTQEVPTVSDNLLSQKTISTEEIGIFFEPISVSSSGELTFGGIDTSRTTSSITFTPITTTFPASQFWGIDQSISIGGGTILDLTAGIVDTGTTLVLLATGACVPVLEVTLCTPPLGSSHRLLDAFDKYVAKTGGKIDEETGFLTITPSQFAALENLDFHIGGKTFSLTPNAQILPRSLTSMIGGQEGQIFLIVNDVSTKLYCVIWCHRL